jgi:polyisoprenoid-binding protein YceI
MTTATVAHTQIPTGTLSVDRTRSTVGFAVKHLGVVPVRGVFREFEGTIEIDTDVRSARAYGSVRAGSLDTKQKKRDEHLRSADFFDATNHPEIRFESTRIEPMAGQTLRIVGELELHGVTRETQLDVDIVGAHENRLTLSARATLSRRDYGMKPSAALVDALIADTVKLELDIEAVRQD